MKIIESILWLILFYSVRRRCQPVFGPPNDSFLVVTRKCISCFQVCRELKDLHMTTDPEREDIWAFCFARWFLKSVSSTPNLGICSCLDYWLTKVSWIFHSTHFHYSLGCEVNWTWCNPEEPSSDPECQCHVNKKGMILGKMALCENSHWSAFFCLTKTRDIISGKHVEYLNFDVKLLSSNMILKWSASSHACSAVLVNTVCHCSVHV